MYSIRQIAELSGVTVKTIRHYESKGLLLPKTRTDSGYRLYDESSLTILNRIKLYKQFGFSLSEIKSILLLEDEGNSVALEYLLRMQHKKLKESSNKTKEVLSQLHKTLLSRRKKENCNFSLALLVIDMQNDFVNGVLGNERAKKILTPVSMLITTAREKGIPIIFACDSHRIDKDHELLIWGEHALEGTEGAQIVEELGQEASDFVIKKHTFNSFSETTLQELLTELGVNQLMVCGLHIDFCVSETIISAYHLGYRVLVPKDAVESLTEDGYQLGLNLLSNNYKVELLDLEAALKYISEQQKSYRSTPTAD